jgi:hypothetical protein
MPSRRVRVAVAAVVFLAAVIAAAMWFAAPHGGVQGDNPDQQGTTDFAARFAHFKAAPEPNGDLSKVVWPDFVTKAGPEVKRLYEFQVTHGELMRYMPCFCGCGDFAGHRSNRDCYVRRVNRDGSVVFDDMAPT